MALPAGEKVKRKKTHTHTHPLEGRTLPSLVRVTSVDVSVCATPGFPTRTTPTNAVAFLDATGHVQEEPARSLALQGCPKGHGARCQAIARGGGAWLRFRPDVVAVRVLNPNAFVPKQPQGRADGPGVTSCGSRKIQPPSPTITLLCGRGNGLFWAVEQRKHACSLCTSTRDLPVCSSGGCFSRVRERTPSPCHACTSFLPPPDTP